MELICGMVTSETNTIVNSALHMVLVFSDEEYYTTKFLIRNKDKVVINEQSGYLMRTKVSSSDEGGVAAGFAVLDSLYLTGKVMSNRSTFLPIIILWLDKQFLNNISCFMYLHQFKQSQKKFCSLLLVLFENPGFFFYFLFCGQVKTNEISERLFHPNYILCFVNLMLNMHFSQTVFLTCNQQ